MSACREPEAKQPPAGRPSPRNGEHIPPVPAYIFHLLIISIFTDQLCQICSLNARCNSVVIPGAIRFFTPTKKRSNSMCFLFESKSPPVIRKGSMVACFLKQRVMPCSSSEAGCRAALIALLRYGRSESRHDPSRPRYATCQFIPFNPFLPGGMVLSCCRTLYSGVPCGHGYLWGVPLSGTLLIPLRARAGLTHRSRLQPSQCSGQNLLCVKYFILDIKEYLTRKFLTAVVIEAGDGFLRVSGRKGGETHGSLYHSPRL